MTYKIGSTGAEVQRIQEILVGQGYGVGVLIPNGVYDDDTEAAVRYFQMTHIDSEGRFLEVDGVAGPKTMWALSHPSGSEQRNRFDPQIPDGIGEARTRRLGIALSEHAAGVHEIPDGSNWGDGVVKYGGLPGWAWCMLFMSWIDKTAFGQYLLGARFASVYQGWKRAEELGLSRPLDAQPRILPGDQFVMLNKNAAGRPTGTGHTGLVLRVSADGTRINTVEGNCGNRVKVGERAVASLHGVITLPPGYENVAANFERGLLSVKSVAGEGTR